MGKGLARKIAKRILAEHEKGRSYRAIVEQDYPSIKPGTLNRFAKSQGEWIPKNKEILAALGLYKPRLPYPRPSWLFKWYHTPKDERYAVMKSHVENGHSDEEQRRAEKEIKGILEWLNG